MSAAPVDDPLEDLLPDDLNPAVEKKAAVPLVRSEKQLERARQKAEKDQLAAQAQKLAQVVNLHISGYSLADIGAAIGASESEIERMLSNDMARYVRSQPALRTYVRNYISGKYTQLLEAVWDQSVDQTNTRQLEYQDRALRVLDRMAKLHGAEMPVQAEVKMDAAPEAVERLVAALSAGKGLGYRTDIFDTVPGAVVHSAVEESEAALVVSGNRVEQADPDDTDI